MSEMLVKLFKMYCSDCVLLLCVMNQAQLSLFDCNQPFILRKTNSYYGSLMMAISLYYSRLPITSTPAALFHGNSFDVNSPIKMD